MALQVLFNLLSGKRTPKIGSLEIDVVYSEKHSFVNMVSTFPVEAGSEISDNALQYPNRLTLEGMITNTPVKLFGTLGFDGFTNPLEDEVQNALDILLKIAGREYDSETGTLKAPELVTVVTGLKVYPNMMIETLDIPRTAKTGQILHFTANFVEVKQVNSESVEIPAEILNEAEADIAQSGQNVGRQPASTPGSTARTRASVLATMFPE